MQKLITHLAQIVGAQHVLSDSDLAEYEQDWRRRQRGQALCVVRPACVEEVAGIVKACIAARQFGPVSIVPQGGNTGLVLGSTPDSSAQQVVVSLRRLHAVRAIDPHNLTMTLEAGCVLQNAQQAAEQAGYLFPLSLGAEGSCSIGGNLSTNAGGTQVLRYGNARELCLGLEVVTAQGEIWHGLSGLRKDNTGYDLRNLYIGSEGTLGIITAATMRLYPRPVAQATAWVAVDSLEAAKKLLALAQQNLAANLTGFEVMNQLALCLVNQHYPQLKPQLWQQSAWCVLIENSSHDAESEARAQLEALLQAALEMDIATDAIVAQSLQQASNFWQVRESIPLAQAQEGLNIKHDISVAVSSIPDFTRDANATVTAAIPGARFVIFGHLGDGNLHYNIQAPQDKNPADFLRDSQAIIHAIVYAVVHQYQGSISAEHGIGRLKRSELSRYKSPTALALMRAIKQALDPLDLMNPGVIFEPAASQVA